MHVADGSVLYVFPAWAGMNRISYIRMKIFESVPRVGGDEPAAVTPFAPADFVFPAWAGMNRLTVLTPTFLFCVPRVGGDEPDMTKQFIDDSSCSPRGRG